MTKKNQKNLIVDQATTQTKCVTKNRLMEMTVMMQTSKFKTFIDKTEMRGETTKSTKLTTIQRQMKYLTTETPVFVYLFTG